MNSYDPQKAARVWQRVQETQAQPREENWPGLIQEALAAQAAYQALARQLPREAQRLQRLAREARGTAAALGGICRLERGSAPDLKPLPAPAQRLEVTLGKCCAQCLARVRAYEGRSRDGTYAPVFRQLAAREQEHSLVLLELLGETVR